MFNEPLPFTVNCVVKLNPEASPVPPCKAALQIPLAAFCVVGVLLLPHFLLRYEPAIVLFGYLRHGLIGRGVEVFGVILLLLNFLDGLYKLARLNWHTAYQIVMSICYIALSVRLVQLILAFRGE